jgi:hypothetical protein
MEDPIIVLFIVVVVFPEVYEVKVSMTVVLWLDVTVTLVVACRVV